MKKVLLVVLIMVFMLVLATAAFAEPGEKVHVCHVNGADDVVLIYISDNAFETHEAHGDAAAVEGPLAGQWSCGGKL